MRDWRPEMRIIVLTSLLVILHVPAVSACSGRQVLNVTSGVITDGRGEYPASAHCEWLIIGTDALLNPPFVHLYPCFHSSGERQIHQS